MTTKHIKDVTTVDIVLAVPLSHDEGAIWESVARHYGVGPVDLFHLSALQGLRYQLQRNGATEHAEMIENTIREYARFVGLEPVEREPGDPEAGTFERARP